MPPDRTQYRTRGILMESSTDGTSRLQSVGDHIVMSRLLVLQSRRVMLATREKALVEAEDPELRREVERLRATVSKAQDEYRRSVLAWANSETSQFWMVAYSAMVEGAESLMEKLNDRSAQLPLADRAFVQSDLAQLNAIVSRWRAHMVKGLEDDDEVA